MSEFITIVFIVSAMILCGQSKKTHTIKGFNDEIIKAKYFY